MIRLEAGVLDQLPDLIESMPDDQVVEIVHSVRTTVGALRRRREASVEPELADTTWCVRRWGYDSRTWRKWCEEGEIPGATKTSGKRWSIPVEAARAYIERYRRGGEEPGVERTPRPRSSAPRDRSRPRRRFHGPRRLTTVKGGQP